MSMSKLPWVAVLFGLQAGLGAQGNCERVLQGFEPPGADGNVLCFQAWDDGSGLAQYAGGSFASIGTAAASNVARFDGARWTPLGLGIEGAALSPAYVDDLAVFDFGSGARLVVGGRFDRAGGAPANHVAAWDGTAWTAIGGGLNNAVQALAVHDDGSGTKLYAAGDFHTNYARVVRWNGAAWEQVGLGLLNSVYDLATHDDGGGLRLYAGTWDRVYRWDGANWQALGATFEGPVHALVSHDDGTGSKLYAAVRYHSGAVQGVRRWNGTNWEPVGTIGGAVNALERIDLGDGSGLQLYAAGDFSAGANRVARWNGTTWTTLGVGPVVEAVALAAIDAGTGPRLYAGLSLYAPGSTQGFGLARLEGSNWIPAHPGHGLVGSLSLSARALAQHDDGAGPEVHVGGRWMYGVPAAVSHPIARWTDDGWVGSTFSATIFDGVQALESFDAGSSPELYAGTANRGIWRRTGANWSDVNEGPLVSVYDFLAFDLGGGSHLAAAGYGLTPPPPGFQAYAAVSTWDGVAGSWSTIGTSAPGSIAYALAVFDDGRGSALYCGGSFGQMNGVPGTAGIARWNGAGWASVGGGTNAGGTVRALAVFDDGSGPALYAAGRFASIGGATIADIARWDGQTWSAVGTSGAPGPYVGIAALAAHDGPSGPILWAGGDFTSIGGVAANRLGRWDGSAWSAFGTGADGNVTGLASFDERTGHPRTLWVTGDFSSIDGRATAHVARIGCAPDAGRAFCFGDSAHGPSPCPCGNPGSTGHGCASVAAPAGALLGASGSTTPVLPGGIDSVVLDCAGLPAVAPVLFFQGDAQLAPSPFGDGVRCVGGAQIRLATKFAFGGAASYPEPGDLALSVRGLTPPGSGRTRYYQAWYRTALTLCTPAAFNLSNGWTITW